MEICDFFKKEMIASAATKTWMSPSYYYLSLDILIPCMQENTLPDLYWDIFSVFYLSDVETSAYC